MSTPSQSPSNEQLGAYNYCISFLDLLGQREALRGEGWLPDFHSDEDRKQFLRKLKNSIGSIMGVQQQAEIMMGEILDPRPDSPVRNSLHPDLHPIWDDMQKSRIKTQRWSDGLVSFTCLGDREIKCHMNGLFGIFGLAGSVCLIGLATHRPVRGGIDAAWAVELHPGELYGAAVARAYELESEIASYPRIVVGSRVVELLEDHRANIEQDLFSQNDREIASLCLSMLLRDTDGSWILHYLGKEFQAAITQGKHRELYLKASDFIVQQLQEHQASGNTKLAFRYAHLLQYFNEHLPLDTFDGEAQPHRWTPTGR